MNFDEPIITKNRLLDNTSDRIYGIKKFEPMLSETHFIGRAFNPADNLPKIGKKTLI